MVRQLSDIEQDAMALSRQERARLVEHLLATLDPGEDVDAEDLWLEEAEKRYAQYRAGKLKSKPADQVFREARERFR